MAQTLNNMYLINAPAGSGKTTYIENTILDLTSKYPDRKILCITYTNRAKEELEHRIDILRVHESKVQNGQHLLLIHGAQSLIEQKGLAYWMLYRTGCMQL